MVKVTIEIPDKAIGCQHSYKVNDFTCRKCGLSMALATYVPDAPNNEQ